jgi:hypothetical protein
MAKVLTGVQVKLATDPDDYDKTGYTKYEVRGDSAMIYVVTVDSEGLWSCSCPSSTFRGLCYHIQMIRTELERIAILNRIPKIAPVIVNARDFERYYNQGRFIAEPLYGGPRQFVTFGRWIYLDKNRRKEWCLPGHLRLAGTVLEGAWDNYGRPRGRGVFRVIDCLCYKGIDYRLSPLALRREMAERALHKWCPSHVALTEYEFTPEGKAELMAKYGVCMLKDINSPYDLANRSPRAWMVKARTGRGENNSEKA